MQKLIREIPLPSGVTFQFFDGTRRYFGDYHQVRVKISCEVPVKAEYFEGSVEHQAALKILGEKVQYLKEVEHQGVPTEAVSETMENVIQHFVEHSLGYFENDAFPKKFVHSELKRIRNRGKLFIRMHSNG
jgi:hypothetical protein